MAFRAHDKMRPPKIIEVQLCLGDHFLTEDGWPALTSLCITEEEVEAHFERVVSAVRKKKSQAKAIIRRSYEAHRH
jgi:hypothetical protein